MNSRRQEKLRYCHEKWPELRGAFCEAVHVRGLKQFAFDVGVSDSLLAHAMTDEDHHPRMEWLLTAIEISPRSIAIKMIQLLADIQRCDLTPRPVATDGQMLAAVVRELGPETTQGRAVLEAAAKSLGADIALLTGRR